MCDFVTVKAEKDLKIAKGRDHNVNLSATEDVQEIDSQAAACVEGDEEIGKTFHM